VLLTLVTSITGIAELSKNHIFAVCPGPMWSSLATKARNGLGLVDQNSLSAPRGIILGVFGGLLGG